jgi:hypothetical protein
VELFIVLSTMILMVCSTDSDFEPFFRVGDSWKGYPGIGCDIAAVEMSNDFARILGIPKQGAFFYGSCEKCGLVGICETKRLQFHHQDFLGLSPFPYEHPIEFPQL